MKRTPTQAERNLMIQLAAAQILGVVKTGKSQKTKRIKRHVLEILEILGTSYTDMDMIADLQKNIGTEAGWAGHDLFWRKR